MMILMLEEGGLERSRSWQKGVDLISKRQPQEGEIENYLLSFFPSSASLRARTRKRIIRWGDFVSIQRRGSYGICCDDEERL